MTRTELVQALRARFRRLHQPWASELVKIVDGASDEQILRSHVTCGACGRLFMSVSEFVALAERHGDVDGIAKYWDALVERTHPRCFRKLRKMSKAIETERAKVS